MLSALALSAALTLQAGAHEVDITPDTLPIIVSGGFLAATAERLSGTLHARALAVDDGEGRIVIAVVDTLMMPRELLDRVKDAAARTTGIPPERMLISATHSHSTPPVMGALGTDENAEYARLLESRLVAAIEGAVKNLTPARVGWAVVQAAEHTHCRRWILRPDRMRKDPFGELTVRAHMHPGYQNPDFVGPAGPVDPDLSLLAFQSPDGRPLALLANYSMHYVGAGGRVVSPDYFGPFVEQMRRRIGAPGLVAMMSQGTSGDQHWMDYSQPKQDVNLESYAAALAEIAAGAYGKIVFRDWAPVSMAETRLRLGRRLASPERLAWAREMVARMGGAPPKNQEEVYAREQVLIAAEPERELKLQAVRIGELGIAAIPNEVFAITGLKIKAQSPLQPTFNIELANGADGYIPPPEQFRLGGYTTWAARTAGLEVNAEPKIVDAVLGLLEQVAGKRRRPLEDTHGAYAKKVLAARPLAYWRANELQGPAARDASGRGNHGEYEGGVAFYLEGVEASRAPHFAGGGMSATIPGLRERYSVELWFYSSLPVTGCLVARGAERLCIGGTAGAAGKLFFEAGGTVLEGGTVVGLREWNHVVLARRGSRVAVYLNGSAEPEISGAVPPAAGAVLRIGASGFEGKIDEIAVYNRALSGSERR